MIGRMFGLGTALILVAVVGWPLIEEVGGVLMRDHPPAQVVTLRYAAHLALLLPVAVLWSGTDVFRTRRIGLQLLRGFAMFLMPVVFVTGSGIDGAPWMWSVFWTMVLLVLGAAVLMGERPARTAWALAAIGLLGAWLAKGSPTGGAVSATLGLASAASFGAYLVLSRVLRKERLSTSLFYTALGALVPTLFLAAEVWVPVDLADLAPALGLGVLSLLILGAIDLSLEREQLSLMAPWLILVPALEVILASGIASSLPGERPILGVGLILASAGGWAVLGHGPGTSGPKHRARSVRDSNGCTAPPAIGDER